MVAIAAVTSIAGLLALIYIGSPTVYSDVISLSVSGLYASYFVPCSFLLWRRTTGQIRDYRPDDNENDPDAFPITSITASHQENPNGHVHPSGGGVGSVNNSSGNDTEDEVIELPLVWGPWRVPGILGTMNNAFACVYIVFVIFWSFWPTETPATPQNMNYSVLVTGAVIGFSIIYYFIWGKKQYLGPLIEVEVRGMVRRI